jgi:hypothetical protein
MSLTPARNRNPGVQPVHIPTAAPYKFQENPFYDLQLLHGHENADKSVVAFYVKMRPKRPRITEYRLIVF